MKSRIPNATKLGFNLYTDLPLMIRIAVQGKPSSLLYGGIYGRPHKKKLEAEGKEKIEINFTESNLAISNQI